MLVALIALGSAAMRRDSDAMGATFIGMFRAGIGTGIVLAITVMALSVADGITNWVAADAAGKEAAAFWGDVSTAWDGGDSAGFGSSAIAFVFALVQVLAGLAVWLELLVRSAAIYVAVLFMPMALAAGIWPKLQAWQTRLASLLFIMIAMKPAIVVVLSLAGSAAAAGGDADKDFGILVAAVMILVLAAFVPWVLMMLISMDGESSWTARQAAGSMKGAVAGGTGRVGGGLGSAASRVGGALGGARAGRGGGGSAPGGGGAGGSAGGGSPGGGGPGGRGPGGGAAAARRRYVGRTQGRRAGVDVVLQELGTAVHRRRRRRRRQRTAFGSRRGWRGQPRWFRSEASGCRSCSSGAGAAAKRRWPRRRRRRQSLKRRSPGRQPVQRQRSGWHVRSSSPRRR